MPINFHADDRDFVFLKIYLPNDFISQYHQNLHIIIGASLLYFLNAFKKQKSNIQEILVEANENAQNSCIVFD